MNVLYDIWYDSKNTEWIFEIVMVHMCKLYGLQRYMS